LLGIAEVAGDDWREYAREAAKHFTYREADPAEVLLQEVYGLFDQHNVDRLPSETIVKALAELEH